jgi:hypothetical protein
MSGISLEQLLVKSEPILKVVFEGWKEYVKMK